MYTTPFGPIVDGVVIPDNPVTTLSHYKTFSKYDVMFGLTESEAFHLFPASLGMSPAPIGHGLRDLTGDLSTGIFGEILL